MGLERVPQAARAVSHHLQPALLASLIPLWLLSWPPSSAAPLTGVRYVCTRVGENTI